MKVNKNFDNLVPNYLFADVARKTNEFAAAHPEKEIIRLGIGDVTLPLAPIVVEAMKKGCEDLKYKDTFKGYPEYEGYDFVREAIAGYYKSFGVQVAADEIFVSDGAKSDCGNLPDIFAQDNTVLVTDPVYPVYVDANIMAGRRIIYAASNKENHFLAMPDERVKADIIYLCSPNNPTGAAYSAEQLQAWVEYALKNDAVILYDAAYEAFIADDSPRSIFAVDGARECAIELCSLSKTAGFTGTRCGYTVIPKELRRGGHSLHALWYRRQATKFNGVSWPVQCAAAAVFSHEGLQQIQDNLNYYRRNAQVISSALDALGIYYTGGKNAPYIWMECPDGMGSWQFFDYLLQNAAVVGTPGEGFGENGKGYFRLTSFGSYEKTTEAVERIRSLLR
ncbi:MAG: LL-diaminopimelate aminotransferase [Ruminococcus sp.]|nr:LL-diaminopimelate aminotransferase [Ruminococcus sp.]MBQ5744563.1 LL-diaminopimelate aminotransferase [Ruminococcus sp.]